MTIRSRLYLGVCFFSLLISVLVISLRVIRVGLVTELITNMEVVHELHKIGDDLQIITQELLVADNERLDQEWHSRYAALGLAIKKVTQLREEDKKEFPGLDLLTTEYDATGKIFAGFKQDFLLAHHPADGQIEKETEMRKRRANRKAEKMMASLRAMDFAIEKLEHAFRAHNQKSFNRMQTVSFVVLFLILFGLVLSGLWLARMITTPLKTLRDGAHRVAQGELGITLPIESNDEIGTVAAAFNQMSTNLAEGYEKLQVEVGKRREAQEEIASKADLLEKKNQELARRNADLDEFTYVASHDLQEPLRKIISFGNLLIEDLGTNLPEQAASDLAYMSDAAKRMQALIYDLLAFSRSGRVAMSRDLIPLDKCVDQALDTLSSRLEESGVQIVRGPLPKVHGDSALLTQLYQNLIGNALKFGRPGEPPVIELTAEEDEENFILGIKDNGIGFKQEYAAQIFQPFKRLHGREEFEGSGIGLAICRKIVERHGGIIWAESTLGAGAQFKFCLPKQQILPEQKQGKEE